MTSAQTELLHHIDAQDCVVGVVGLGYVGLPLALAMTDAGYCTVGFDISDKVVAGLGTGQSHILDIPDEHLAAHLVTGRLSFTTDLARLRECDAVVICVPTPLSKHKDPDLTHVLAAARAVGDVLRPGQLVLLESTTYPGTTRDAVLPILTESGLAVGEDFFLCFSPERVDPANTTWHIRNTPKLLGGLTATCRQAGLALYERVFDTVVPVSSVEVAELAKVYENTFRMVNIALANELAQACAKLDLDVWEVIDAAATKPFGFMKFVPGPGLGGHCIPLDPLYLSWKMRTLAFTTRLIEQASAINAEMPDFVVAQVADALNDRGQALHGSRVLVLGGAYKPDVADARESPALEIIAQLQAKGVEVAYHDPLCPVIADDIRPLAGQPIHSVDLTDALLAAMDVVLIVTNHSTIDYQRIAATARLVVDTRGAMRNVTGTAEIIGLSGVPIQAPVASPAEESVTV